MTHLQDTLDLILKECEPSRKYNGYWMATCPVHKKADGSHENTPSLSVTEKDGKILLHCQSDCSTADILAKLNLQWSDLFADSQETAPTLQTLAQYTQLHIDFLATLGLKDQKGGVLVPYVDEDGAERTYRIRVKLKGKDKYRSLKGGGVYLYGANRKPNTEMVLVEGESDCWTLWNYGIGAYGIPGITNCKVLLKRNLKGIERLFISCESDQAGERFVVNVCKQLYSLGWTGQTFVIRMPAGCKDPSDLHKARGSDFKAAWQEVIAKAEPIDVKETVHKAAAEADNQRETEKPAKTDPVQELVNVAMNNARIIQDVDSEMAIARIEVPERFDCPVYSKTFREWLMRSFGRIVKDGNLKDALANIAVKYSAKMKTYTRVARVERTIFLDLYHGGKVVKITADGWSVTDNSGVLFLRGRDMAPQCEPKTGGSIAELRQFVNVTDEDWPLYLAFLLESA